MHDPMTVAHEIKYPWRAYPKNERDDSFRRNYRRSFITIWHVDPERDGSDDSCGWFMRVNHGKPAILEQITKAFACEWDRESGGWFDRATGMPRFTSQAIALMMFRRAAFIYFGGNEKPTSRIWNRTERFMQRNLFDILYFAENDTDSMHDGLIQRFGRDVKRDDRIRSHAAMVYGWILRRQRPWYQHPRWHVWHWSLQVHPLQEFKRWAFSRCAGCRKRFSWGYSPVTFSWNGGGPRWFRGEAGVYHSDCTPPPATKKSQVH